MTLLKPVRCRLVFFPNFCLHNGRMSRKKNCKFPKKGSECVKLKVFSQRTPREKTLQFNTQCSRDPKPWRREWPDFRKTYLSNPPWEKGRTAKEEEESFEAHFVSFPPFLCLGMTTISICLSPRSFVPQRRGQMVIGSHYGGI